MFFELMIAISLQAFFSNLMWCGVFLNVTIRKVAQEELDHLKMLVEAWSAHLGEPEVKPYFLPLDDHLTENP